MTDFLDRVMLADLQAAHAAGQPASTVNGCPCDFCTGVKRYEDNWCARCGEVQLAASKWWENEDVCDACEKALEPETFPRSPLGATDALDALPTTRDEREALRARGEPVASVEAEDPHVPAGPRCRACGSIHGVWVRTHWKPGAAAGDRPCPEGFKP